MKRTIRLTFTCILMALLATTATAQPGGRSGPRRGGPRGDGGPRPPAHPVQVALDTDKDGQLSANELANATAALKSLDRNEDGKLSHAELRPEFGHRGPERREPATANAARKGKAKRPSPPDGNRRRGSDLEGRLKGMDANRDGELTRDEVPERMAERLFDRADKDENGKLDRAELQIMRERFAARSGQDGARRGPEDGARRGRQDGARRGRQDGARRGRQDGARRGRQDGARRGRQDGARRGRQDGARRGRQDGERDDRRRKGRRRPQRPETESLS